jgi:formylglycine-generating enzyme required for sulfatase activity
MRTIVLLFAALAGIFATSGPKKPTLPQNYVLVPSGTTVNDRGQQVSMLAFYMCNAEVTNLEYQEFLADLQRREKTEDLAIAKIHPEGWQQVSEVFQDYHTLPAYQNYPVVNISQAGARLYCAWLTEMYAEQNPDFQVTFRLPTEAQWKYAAHGGLSEKFPYPHGQYLRATNGQFLYNFKRLGDEAIHYDLATKTYQVKPLDTPTMPELPTPAIVPARGFQPNGYGLYHTSGNVAEMLQETGRTVGGCFNSTGYDIRIDAPDAFAGFSKPSPYIGFRPVAIVEQRQK